MELGHLYEMQNELDDRIIKEKGLEEQDLLPNTILALQVEGAELANEWRGFKHWSNDREPRYVKKTIAFADPGGPVEHVTYPLIEEYVDCLHFYLSIARQLGIQADELITTWEVPTEETTTLFIDMITAVGLSDPFDTDAFHDAWRIFCQIGTRLGFTWEEITAAYLNKNKINHERQSNGY